MPTVDVALGERAYSIHIGRGLLSDPAYLPARLSGQPVAVVSNETVAPLYLQTVHESLLAAGAKPFAVILPDGEAHKNWQTLNRIFDALLKQHCERGSTLVALGGGVIGDMGGFAAACYQRGMNFIQMPTTLLAQVDASVGGKTAINHPLGKNMIGAFHQPSLVLVDIDTLATLPQREFSAGMAEVIKYGLIRDADFLHWLEANMSRLMARDEIPLAEAIYRACRHKAEIVAADERERGGRALLNLGHTFGHAIETGLGYGVWLHGEAVAAGTLMAARLSTLLGWLSTADVARIERLFAAAVLPVRAPALGAERYLQLMRHDKKIQDGRLRLILMKSLGEAVVSETASEAQIAEAIRECSQKLTTDL
ncbi:MAG: 3-dehydroquinate synthase [Zoogloeaceae bacterium]|jgi:3-dehydroquinate synthase|nr:3-dehydroquinate synthase [Zoogloeaceae bacterium]